MKNIPVRLAVFCGLVALGACQATDSQTEIGHESKSSLRYIPVKHKSLTTIKRGEDLTVSEDGKWAWTCTGQGETAICTFNALTGQIVERFGKRDAQPQNILCHRDALFVITDSGRRPRPRLMIYGMQPKMELRRDIPLDDWRLYRTLSACLSSDGDSLWLTSSPNMSSLYGRVDPALFRLDVEKGSLLRILGPPPDKMNSELSLKLRPPLFVTVDEETGVVVSDPSLPALRVFPNAKEKESKQVELEFAPKVLPRRIKRYLPLVADKTGVVIDTTSWSIVSRFELPGNPSAVCVDSGGTTTFVATARSNNVLKINMTTGDILGQIDLSRPGGKPGIADASRGRNVHDIVALRWADHPERLLALGYDGYIFIVVILESKDEKSTEPDAPADADKPRR